MLLLRVPLKRDLNGDGIVTAEEDTEVDELSRKVRRRIIVGTVVFAIPCIVMTAGSIGSAQAGVQDGYGVTKTTRELAAVLPGFKDYTVAVETSAAEGEEEGIVEREVVAHVTTSEEVMPAREECSHGRKLRRGAGAIRTRANCGVQFTPAPRSLFYCRESTVQIDIARLHRKRRIGTHKIKSGHLSISN